MEARCRRLSVSEGNLSPVSKAAATRKVAASAANDGEVPIAIATAEILDDTSAADTHPEDQSNEWT
jgi:hypothetical protein